MSENRDSHERNNQIVGQVKKSFLLVLIGGLVAEWVRLSLNFRSRTKKPKG
jgi:hypothetical protein